MGKPRGFACLTPEQRKELASRGGKAAHAKGTAHEWNHDQAVEAGRKGGSAVSKDRQHMADIGKLGVQARKQAPEGEEPAE